MQIDYSPNREISIQWSRWRKAVKDVIARIWEPPERGDAWEPPLLDLAAQPSQPSPRASFKRHPIRKTAKHKIMKHAALFEDSQKSRQVFITGTLPGSTEESLKEFCRLAAPAVKFFQTYLPRALGLRATELEYVWVWELQQRLALHIHAVVQLPSAELANRLVESWADIWGSILRAVNAHSPCDLFERWYGGSWENEPNQWQTDAQIVTKSAGRYLSKYMGEPLKAPQEFYPPRWYGISSGLRARMRAWAEQHCYWTMIRPARGLTFEAIAEYASKELEEFCVGRCGSRKPWNEPNRLWIYGYLREDVSEGEAVSAMIEKLKLLEATSAMAPRKEGAVKAMERAKFEVREGYFKFWPYWLRDAVQGAVPRASYEKFAGNLDMDRFEYMDIAMVFRREVNVNMSDYQRGASWVQRSLVAFQTLCSKSNWDE